MQDDIEQLLAAIKDMADAEKAEVRAGAEQEIAKITERTEVQIGQFREEALAKLEEQLRMESECIVGRAELEMRDRLIYEKNEAIREVFESAAEQIAALDNPETYKTIFKRLVREAIDRINCKDVRLRISRTDQSIWESLKGEFLVPVVLNGGPKGTIIVETDDGSRSVDNSIETRLEMAREVMRRELVGLLFDDEASGEKGK